MALGDGGVNDGELRYGLGNGLQGCVEIWVLVDLVGEDWVRWVLEYVLLMRIKVLLIDNWVLLLLRIAHTVWHHWMGLLIAINRLHLLLERQLVVLRNRNLLMGLLD